MSRDALVVGINIYQNAGLKNLTSPAADAEAIAQMLEKHGEFDVVRRFPEAINKENKSFVGKKLEVSLKELKKALVQLFKPDGKHIPETALFYFSGHGLRNTLGISEGFLATSDSHPDLEFYGLSMNWLRQLLAESPIRQQVIWLDCCHSGELLISDANPGNLGLAGDRCFIASSREFEASLSDLQSPYSVMTKALLDGLDPNRLPGRDIDTFALADYVNQALKSEPQTPMCTNFGSGINLVRSPHIQPDEPETAHEDTGICPYKGLEFFDCNDEDPKYFFGRDDLVDELLDKVRTSNFMALVGASGNGKSSVLRAGLLHQLKLGERITESENWKIRFARPDDNPIRNLALSLFDEKPSDMELNNKTEELKTNGASKLKQFFRDSLAPRTILVIDQFEEVFTRCESQEEREIYLACLMEALAEPKLCLIIAMRADFIGKCLEHEYSGLAQQVQANMISVLPMQREELEAAICQPAKQVKLKVEQTLVTQILNEIAGAPGSLPLLQYTLKELWQQRTNNQLTLLAYQELGGTEKIDEQVKLRGLVGVLDKRATEIYNSFPTKVEKDATRHIFLKLTQLGEGTEDTRRRVLQSSLIAEPKYPAALIEKVIAKLADPENRLIVTSKSEKDKQEAIVDVVHETLIRNWRLLREWIEANRDLLRQQRKIEASAEAWQNQNKNSGYLLQHLLLKEAQFFQKQYYNEFPLSDIAKTFIKQSIRYRRINFLKTASWAIIPALIIGGFVEAQYREEGIKRDYSRIDNAVGYEQRKAVEDLVQGCNVHKRFPWIPLYLVERVFGNCRVLDESNLHDVNLRDVNLSGASFLYANLRLADLSDANLSGASFLDADLRLADLGDANLSNADFTGSFLNDSNFSGADLRNATLERANLSKADLIDTNLSGAIFGTNAVFIDADFAGANLNGANFTSTSDSPCIPFPLAQHGPRPCGAELSHLKLNSADLSNANLSGVDLSNANLDNTTLNNTNLKEAYLYGASLDGADLNNVDLSYADLSHSDITGAVIEETDLSSVILSEADLSNTRFFHTNFKGADLSSAILAGARFRNSEFINTNFDESILLLTDLRQVSNLTSVQLSNELAPLLCHVALPENIQNIDPNRDCEKITQVLVDRYSLTLEQAETVVSRARASDFRELPEEK